MVREPDRAIAALSLSSAAEQKQLLGTWNQTAVNFEPALNIVQRLQRVASSTSAATAFICGQQRLTFQELNLRANQLAHHLQSIGIKPGMRVGICLECTFEVPIGVLAIFKMGGVYVPLDPRLARMVQDAEIAAIITQSEWLPKLPSAGTPITRTQILCLDTLADTLAGQPTDDSSIVPALDIRLLTKR